MIRYFGLIVFALLPVLIIACGDDDEGFEPAEVGFETYENTAFGYAIDYPGDWQVAAANPASEPERADIVEILNRQPADADPDDSGADLVRIELTVVENREGLSVSDFSEELYRGFEDPGTIESTETLSVTNADGLKHTVEYDGTTIVNAIVPLEDERFLTISGPSTGSEFIEEFEYMLSSIHVLDVTNGQGGDSSPTASQRQGQGGEASPEMLEVFESLPEYPNAELTRGPLMQGVRILYAMYVTTDAPSEVIEFYSATLPGEGWGAPSPPTTTAGEPDESGRTPIVIVSQTFERDEFLVGFVAHPHMGTSDFNTEFRITVLPASLALPGS